MGTRRRFLIVHNVMAGVRRRRILEDTCEALRSRGAAIVLERADSLDADERIARQASSSHVDAVVAAGGDSTVRGVAAGLAGTRMPLGIIPAGTGNVLAEEIGLTRNPARVAHCLMHGEAIDVTGGRAGGHTFYEMAGAGFDARLLERLDVGLKQRLGKLAYAWPVLAELTRRQPRFTIEVDGDRMQCTWAIVAKVSRYAGGFTLTREQSLTQPGFHAVVVDARSRLALLGVLVALGMGRIGWHPAVRILRCERARFPDASASGMQIDGEPIQGASFEIEPAPLPLRLIVPDRGQAG